MRKTPEEGIVVVEAAFGVAFSLVKGQLLTPIAQPSPVKSLFP